MVCNDGEGVVGVATPESKGMTSGCCFVVHASTVWRSVDEDAAGIASSIVVLVVVVVLVAVLVKPLVTRRLVVLRVLLASVDDVRVPWFVVDTERKGRPVEANTCKVILFGFVRRRGGGFLAFRRRASTTMFMRVVSDTAMLLTITKSELY
jgi:hypothetical protein